MNPDAPLKWWECDLLMGTDTAAVCRNIKAIQESNRDHHVAIARNNNQIAELQKQLVNLGAGTHNIDGMTVTISVTID